MKHSQSEFWGQLVRPEQSARELGYRMPAEWEPLEAVWLTLPHNEETWPACLPKARAQFEVFVEQLRRFVRVEIVVSDDSRSFGGSTIRQHKFASNDSWIRDYGPIFVVGPKGELACHDFIFNGWGGKYGGKYGSDDIIPQTVAARLKIPIWVHNMVLEGGSIEVNGRGTVMTTEQCLLNENRNPGKSKEDIELELHNALGTRHCIWLPGGIIGDDTDGHVDDIARFVSPNVVVAPRAPKAHPDHRILERNFAALKNATDQDGKALEVIELPVPEPIIYNFPADEWDKGGKRPCPASYANFLIANDGILVPTFNQDSDDAALRVLEKAFPDRDVLGVRSDVLVIGLGALHCLSQQQPRVR